MRVLHFVAFFAGICVLVFLCGALVVFGLWFSDFGTASAPARPYRSRPLRPMPPGEAAMTIEQRCAARAERGFPCLAGRPRPGTASSRNVGRVHTLCVPAVERLAVNTFRWLVGTGMFEWRFTHTRATTVPNVTTHLGDEIEFQNGFGAWVRHVYECDFDHSRQAVVAARARQGRLP